MDGLEGVNITKKSKSKVKKNQLKGVNLENRSHEKVDRSSFILNRERSLSKGSSLLTTSKTQKSKTTEPVIDRSIDYHRLQSMTNSWKTKTSESKVSKLKKKSTLDKEAKLTMPFTLARDKEKTGPSNTLVLGSTSNLDLQNSEELLKMKVEEMEQRLKSMFKLDPDSDHINASILDYYVAAVYWGKQQHFTAPQLLIFFEIVYQTLEYIRRENPSRVDSFIYFRSLLHEKSSVNCSRSNLIDLDQAKAITKYLHTSLFQHFQLYEFMFTQNCNMTRVFDLSVGIFHIDNMFAPPLIEGISEDVYKNCLPNPFASNSLTDIVPDNQSLVNHDIILQASSDIQSNVSREIQCAASNDIQSQVNHGNTSTVNRDYSSLSPGTDRSTPILKLNKSDWQMQTVDLAIFEKLVSKLTPDDVKTAVAEVSENLLTSLRGGLESKLLNVESRLIRRINKIHIIS